MTELPNSIFPNLPNGVSSSLYLKLVPPLDLIPFSSVVSAYKGSWLRSVMSGLLVDLFWLRFRSRMQSKDWQRIELCADLNMASRITLFRAMSLCSDHSKVMGHCVQPHAFKRTKSVVSFLKKILTVKRSLFFCGLFFSSWKWRIHIMSVIFIW